MRISLRFSQTPTICSTQPSAPAAHPPPAPHISGAVGELGQPTAPSRSCRNLTVPTTAPAARRSVKQGNKGNLLNPWRDGTLFQSYKSKWEKPRCSINVNTLIEKYSFRSCNVKRGAPGLSRTGPWFLSTAPPNFKKLSQSFRHSYSFSPISMQMVPSPASPFNSSV